MTSHSPPKTDPNSRRLATRWVLFVTTVFVLVEMVFAGRYDYHRDELAKLETHRRLAGFNGRLATHSRHA